jgi:hypothetical protein
MVSNNRIMWVKFVSHGQQYPVIAGHVRQILLTRSCYCWPCVYRFYSHYRMLRILLVYIFQFILIYYSTYYGIKISRYHHDWNRPTKISDTTICKLTSMNINQWVTDCCLMPTQQIFSYIMVTSFSGGESRSTRREPSTMGKQLVNFYILQLWVECNLFVIKSKRKEEKNNNKSWEHRPK